MPPPDHPSSNPQQDQYNRGQSGQENGAPQQQPQQQQQPPPLPLADLNRIVLEFLNRKGYTRTEAMFRMESSRTPTPASNQVAPNGGPASGVVHRSGSPAGTSSVNLHNSGNEDPTLYHHAYAALKDWVDNSLDLYQPELRRVLYPIFVHMFLQLISKGHTRLAKQLFADFSPDHMVLHGKDLQRLESISLPQHVKENELAKIFRNKDYVVTISRSSLDLLLFFLHEIEVQGGSIIIRLLNQYIALKVSEGKPTVFDTEGVLDPSEGLGAGVEQVDRFNSQPVKLGKMTMDPELAKEVVAGLEEKDKAEEISKDNVGTAADNTLVEEFYKEGKQENGIENPPHDSIPLPQYKTADVEREIQKVVDARSRIRLGPKQTSLPSVCMYTFHNTHDDLNTLSFSDDSTLVAAGFEDSFVKVWSLKGQKLKSVLKDDEPTTNKRLVGHSGPVYGLSFSPDNRYLLSCSEDKTVRLWSLDTYTGLVSYKGHNHPVWDVKFSPFGHYFATASHDQTARLWSCDHIYPLRIFAGHLSDVENVSFHPNGTYLITGSADKTCRMWDINRGNSVRVFIGHVGPINCTAVSPDGRWMASAGEDSIIHVWDLGSGRRLKSMRGHGNTSIYSLAFSQEGSLLVSGGADNSVRVWDIRKGTGDAGPEPEPLNETTKSAIGESVGVSDTVNGGRQKKKEIQATQDHLAVFYTKRTPVYKVHFTQRNLCLAGGCFTG